jgi:two-component system response regulator LytT
LKILIVEDEPPIAADIAEYAAQFAGRDQCAITVLYTFEEAREFLEKEKIDLLLLDLNVGGKNGFEIPKETVARNFHTIVISAYTDRALEAFDYGILDFVAKPIDKERLRLAFERYFGRRKIEGEGARYLAVHKMSQYFMVPVDTILFFKAVGYLVEIHEADGKIDLIEKALNHLEQILPRRFIRTHRSYIVDINLVQSYRHVGSGAYEITLKDGMVLPLSGRRLKEISRVIQQGT